MTASPFTTAALVRELEAAWTVIRGFHPEVPAAVLVVASGSAAKSGSALTLGHFATSRWQHGDTQLPEVMVSGEGLSRTPAEVLCTLLHEAAHGLATARGIQDTSRQGRWHNAKFKQLADEVGITVTKDDRIGWSVSTLPDTTAQRYAVTLRHLAAVMSAYRHPDPTGATGRANNNNGVSAECACPRRIRVSTSVFTEGPILCGVCGTPFLDPDAEDPIDTTGSAATDACDAEDTDDTEES
ncbi:hypothetical protein [Dactylosporangium sp. CA-139066]|uniref:hypothetical protein n=1 Tax=Dactylosporangium sp. CA-139066 TaxID=3239930 RepID=UPI003D910F02